MNKIKYTILSYKNDLQDTKSSFNTIQTII